MSTTTSPTGSNTSRVAGGQPLALVVLAAGMGSRYGGLKQVEPVGPHGELVIDYSIHDALAAGFDKLVFVIRRDIEAAFRAAIGAKFEGKAEVSYVFQELDALPGGFVPPAGRTKPWGTGHAVLVAQDAVAEPFAVINADDFYGRQGFQALARHLRAGGADTATYALVGFVLRNTLSEFGTVSRGVCRCTPAGQLASVTEMTRIGQHGDAIVNTADDGRRQPLTGDELVSMNMWGFSPAVFAALEQQFVEFLAAVGDQPKTEFYLPGAIDRLIRRGEATVRVLPSTDHWFGVTYPEDRPLVQRGIGQLVDAGLYPAPLWPTT